MQSHRATVRTARFMLVWWVLSLLMAGAAPAMQHGALQAVCSAAGASAVHPAHHADHGPLPAGAALLHHSLDCPLCLAAGGPPPSALGVALEPPLPSPRPLAAMPSQTGWQPVVRPPARAPPRHA